MSLATEKKDLAEPDNRLFPNTKLYCDGRPRSSLRGWFHFFACITFFPMLLTNYIYIFYNSDKTAINWLSFAACITNFLFIYVAHCISAFYHIWDLNLNNEILLQRMDIIGANMYIASSYLPMALLFPTNIGILLIILATILVGWNIFGILNSSYSLHQPVYICLLLIVFGYYIYKFLTSAEYILLYTGIFSLAIGYICLFYEIDAPFNIDPAFFSHFEIYHGFSLICLSSICLMNYSIFKRTFIL